MTSVGAIGGSGVLPGASATGIAPNVAFDQIMDQFRKVAFQTPAERARAAVLDRHRLTEDDYRRLPQPQRDAIDREIAEAVLRAHQDPKRSQYDQGNVTTVQATIDMLSMRTR